MRKIVLIFASAFITLMSQVFAEPKIEFEGRYWVTDLQAETKVTSNSLIGTNIDLRDDLGIDNEDFPEARLTWHTGPNSRIRFAYTQVAYDGSKSLEKIVNFNGVTYAAGTQVNSELAIDYFRLGWVWQFLNFAEDKIKIGPMIEAKAFLLDISLDAPSIPASESEDFMFGLPTIGGMLDFTLNEKLNLFAEASGLPSAGYGHFFDAEAGVRYIPVDNFTVILGYRAINAQIEDDDNFGELRITGPFCSATVRF
jgi:opacity protein-like surface antigen